MALDDLRRRVAGKRRKRAGQHKGHARKDGVAFFGLVGRYDTADLQFVDKFPRLWVREILDDALRRDFSEIVDGDKLIDGCRGERVEAFKAHGKGFCGFFPDISDAERVNQPCKAAFFGFLDCRDEVGGGFFAHAFKVF